MQNITNTTNLGGISQGVVWHDHRGEGARPLVKPKFHYSTFETLFLLHRFGQRGNATVFPSTKVGAPLVPPPGGCHPRTPVTKNSLERGALSGERVSVLDEAIRQPQVLVRGRSAHELADRHGRF